MSSECAVELQAATVESIEAGEIAFRMDVVRELPIEMQLFILFKILLEDFVFFNLNRELQHHQERINDFRQKMGGANTPLQKRYNTFIEYSKGKLPAIRDSL
jgi:hypothetical protein